jgi:hypothetical protein
MHLYEKDLENAKAQSFMKGIKIKNFTNNIACTFCEKKGMISYSEELYYVEKNYHRPYYFCDDAHDELSRLCKQWLLLREVLDIVLLPELVKIICRLFVEIKILQPPICRLNYLNMDLKTMSEVDLCTLIRRRGIPLYKVGNKRSLIRMIKKDMELKKLMWGL